MKKCKDKPSYASPNTLFLSMGFLCSYPWRFELIRSPEGWITLSSLGISVVDNEPTN